ncbi:MAG: WhiB family transcriptional regulator [Trebonia sp.]
MSYRTTDWHRAGACATMDPDLFFPIATGTVAAQQAAEARRVCAVCRVRRQCLEFAMENLEAHGIWGGTTQEERARARRKEADARRYAAPSQGRVAPETAA